MSSFLPLTLALSFFIKGTCCFRVSMHGYLGRRMPSSSMKAPPICMFIGDLFQGGSLQT